MSRVSTTRATRHLQAPRSRVYAALTDPVAITRWKAPTNMTCSLLEFDGTRFRIALTYDAPERAGKTTAHTDVYRGRFLELVPDRKVVEVDEFETTDPDLTGPMTITITLEDTDSGGTELTAVHEGLPAGVAPEDNEAGWRESLDRLAALVEADTSSS
jgi:uncharacterized protein YndB with AHSA1/START domain